jgi:sugar (pentulose or hexulose) kinase
MSQIEARAYRLLAELGSTPLRLVMTAGGGAVNEKWTAMRSAALGVPVQPAAQGEKTFARLCHTAPLHMSAVEVVV